MPTGPRDGARTRSQTATSKTIGGPTQEPLGKKSALKNSAIPSKRNKKRKPSPEIICESDVDENDLNFDNNKPIGQVIDESPKKNVTFA